MKSCLGFFLGAWLVGMLWLFTMPPNPKPEPKTPVLFENTSRHFVYVRGTRWSVDIGGIDPLLNFTGVYGGTVCSNHTIYLQGGLDYTTQRTALLHELLHAGTCDTAGEVHNRFWNSESENGHEGIYKISDFMTSLLHDNPELTHYFSGQ